MKQSSPPLAVAQLCLVRHRKNLPLYDRMEIRKQQSHGKIGEAAVAGKCWIDGIPAYNTAGRRANFVRSDLIFDTPDPKRKLLVQVKTGYSPSPDRVYMTQRSGEEKLTRDKFVADFVAFVNLDRKVAVKRTHQGELDFHHLTFYVVPRDQANSLYRTALKREHPRPLIKTGGQRKLGNLRQPCRVRDACIQRRVASHSWRSARRRLTSR